MKGFRIIQNAILFLAGIFLMVSCGSKESKNQKSNHDFEKVKLSYAKGFQIKEFELYREIDIFDPNDTTKIISHFRLYPKTYTGNLKANELRVPCDKIICLSTTQLAYFIELDATEKIVALNSSRYIFDQKVKNRIKDGSIKRIGKEGNFNVELVAGIDPDLILVSPFKTGGYDAVKNLGIPLMPIAAYNELTPLGRSEWIKLVAVLTGQENDADSVFKFIDSEYKRLKQMTASLENKPTVFSGKLKSGNWYVPGGESFIAQLLRDAGADYIFYNNKIGAYPLDFEVVYSKAYKADFWRLQVSSPIGFNTEKLKTEDRRYADFKAFKKKKIMICNIREKPYYEENPVKPHVILADFIQHFHPELLPDYKTRYYEFLE